MNDPAGAATAPRSPVGIEIADMDRDGIGDVVVVRGGADVAELGSVEIHHGPFTITGDGTSARAAAVWSALPPGAPHLLKPTIADVNGDGCPDLVIGSLEGRAYASVADRSGPAPRDCRRRTKADRLEVLVDDGAGTPVAALGQLVAEDIDGDGHVDLAAARFAVDARYRFSFVRPKVYWGPWPFSAAAERSWTADEALAEAFAVTVVHAPPDAAGRRPPAGLLFGTSAVSSVERPVGDCEDEAAHVAAGDVRLGWGVFVARGTGKQLAAASLFTQDPPGEAIGSYPAVMDLDELPSGNVFVTPSSHKCASCAPRSAPREVAWSPAGDRLVPAGPMPALPSGAWLVTGIGDVDGDATADVVLGRACEPQTQRQGQLYLLTGPERRAMILSLPRPGTAAEQSIVSRATAVGKLGIVTAGGRVVPRTAVVLGDTPVLPTRLGPGGRVGLVLLDSADTRGR